MLKIENQCPLNNLSLLQPVESRLGACVAFVKRHLGIAIAVSVIKVKMNVAKIEIQLPLNTLGLLKRTPIMPMSVHIAKIYSFK